MPTKDEPRGGSRLIDMVAGGLAGGIARVFVAPLDLVKIRLQIDNKDTFGNSRYSSLGGAVRDIYAEEGVVGFWRGNLAAVYLWVAYSGIQFAVYRQAKELVPASGSVSYLISGALAGMAATAITYPLDFVRTSFASQGVPRVYENYRDLILRIQSKRGPAGFFQGLGPALVQICPYISISFSLYESLARYSQARGIGSGWCGFVSGATAKVLVYPLDTIKKRMQVQLVARHPKYNRLPPYNSWWGCLRGMLAHEGMASLYRGVLPATLKSAPATGITFAVYDAVKGVLEQRGGV